MNFVPIDQVVADLKYFSANPQQRVRTGFDSLDYFIDGPAAGEVCTFIGRSYTGKSLLATNIMVNHRSAGSIFFSLEMTKRMALTRMFAQWANFDAREVREAVAQNRIPPLIDDMAVEMAEHVIVDKSGMSVADMMVVIDEYTTYFGHKPKFVQIDYLERIGGVKSEAGGWQATEAAADQVKDLAKTLDLPVFLYHQTNRSEPEHEPPTERSARGGGFTEADFVVGMWAPGRDPKMAEHERARLWNTVRMNVLKNRYSGKQNEPWRPLEFLRSDALRFIDQTSVDDWEEPRHRVAEDEPVLGQQALEQVEEWMDEHEESIEEAPW